MRRFLICLAAAFLGLTGTAVGQIVVSPATITTPVSLANGGTGAALADPGADRVLFWDDSAGTVTWLTMGTNLTITGTTLDATTAAPTDATYITQTTNATLTNEQALSALSTGILRVAITTGVLTSLTDSAGISANISDETGSGVLVFATSPALVTPTITTSLVLTRDAVGVTTAIGLTLQNTTTAAAGAQQYSPRLSQISQGWSTNSGGASMPAEIGWEVRPVQGAAAPTYNYVLAGRINGGAWGDKVSISSSGNLAVTQDITVGANRYIELGTNRTLITASADSFFNLLAATGIGGGYQLNLGTAAPTVTSCGTGTVTSGSRNFAGEITVTGATACTVTFGAPNWTNTPFCTVTLRNATIVTSPYISANSTTAFTVSGLTSNDVFTYICVGRI